MRVFKIEERKKLGTRLPAAPELSGFVAYIISRVFCRPHKYKEFFFEYRVAGVEKYTCVLVG